MRVFVVGASGAIGTRLVRQLIERGHEVIGSSTSSASAERVRQLGAKPVILDLLDPRAVRKSVLGAAGREAGVSRYVAQSFASYRYLQGEPVKTEDDPLEPHPPATMRESSDA